MQITQTEISSTMIAVLFSNKITYTVHITAYDFCLFLIYMHFYSHLHHILIISSDMRIFSIGDEKENAVEEIHVALHGETALSIWKYFNYSFSMISMQHIFFNFSIFINTSDLPSYFQFQYTAKNKNIGSICIAADTTVHRW